MTGFVSGVLARFGYSTTWTFAAAVAIGAAWLFMFPAVSSSHLIGVPAYLNGGTALLVYSGASATVGFAMASLQTVLYQLLEGYRLWPYSYRMWRIERHKSKKRSIQERIAALLPDEELEQGLLRDRLLRYPASDSQIAPTHLGNALRAFESYGYEHYRLDSQLLWIELHSAIPQAVRDEIAGARAGTDFFVAQFYLTIGYGIISLSCAGILWLQSGGHVTEWSLLLQGVASFIVGPMLSYVMALATTDYSASAVRAAVNVGRTKLAESVGLAMPDTIEQERELWNRLTELVREPYHPHLASQIDPFRLPALSAAGTPNRLEVVRSFNRSAPATESGIRPGSHVGWWSDTPVAIRIVALTVITLILVSLVVLIVGPHGIW